MKTLLYLFNYIILTDALNLRNQTNTTITPSNISPWYSFIPIWLLIGFFCCTVGCRWCNSVN